MHTQKDATFCCGELQWPRSQIFVCPHKLHRVLLELQIWSKCSYIHSDNMFMICFIRNWYEAMERYQTKIECNRATFPFLYTDMDEESWVWFTACMLTSRMRWESPEHLWRNSRRSTQIHHYLKWAHHSDPGPDGNDHTTNRWLWCNYWLWTRI